MLAWNIPVILWGALVRVTGSGAGCGNHWPDCNGTFTPSANVATLIEYTHRAMTGLDSGLVVLLVVWAFRAFPRGYPVRLGATLSATFLVTEALIGAALVAKPGGLKERLQRGALLVLSLVLVLSPWMVRNTLVLGEPVWTTTHGGYTLALANNPVYYDEDHARSTEAGCIIAPPTFVQAGAQFDPDYLLRPKIGQPWFGSGREPRCGSNSKFASKPIRR